MAKRSTAVGKDGTAADKSMEGTILDIPKTGIKL